MNVFESFLIKQVLIFKVFPSPIEPFKIIIACCRIYILTVLCCHLSNGVMRNSMFRFLIGLLLHATAMPNTILLYLSTHPTEFRL